MMEIKSAFRSNYFARSAREIFTRMGSLPDTPFHSISRNLRNCKVSTVLDIGANVGQFGIDIRRYGFQGQIVSYEPVKISFDKLSKVAKKYEPWKTFQLGLGALESEYIINVSGNSGLSSSLLQMNELHLENFPDSATVFQQDVNISTIDTQLDVLDLRPQDILLKVDVQGFESEVLKGAGQSLSKIPLCYLEVSIVPLYEGELPFLTILNQLSEHGHEVIEVFRGIKAASGELLQLDILTKRSN